MSFLLTALGSFVAMALGLLGTLADTRKHGKLTVWGKWAVAGIIMASLIGFGSQITDYIQKNQEEQSTLNRIKAETDRANQMLTEMQRAVTRFDKVTVDVSASFEGGSDSLVQYRKFFFQQFSAQQKASPDQHFHEVADGTSAYPNRTRDGPFGAVVSNFELEIAIYSQDHPVKEEDFQPLTAYGQASNGPDLIFRVSQGRRYLVSYDQDQPLQLECSEMPWNEGRVTSLGQIVSIHDLLGAKVFITPTGIPTRFSHWTDVQNKEMHDTLHQITLNNLEVSFDQVKIAIPDSDLKLFDGPKSRRYFFYQIPTDEKDFKALISGL